MKKVAHPKCHGCGSKNPDYESEHFDLRVCYQCARSVADFLDSRDLLQPNVLTQELLDGVFNGGTVPTKDQYTVVTRSRHADNAVSYKVIDRVKSES